jgi:hypothetical protein
MLATYLNFAYRRERKLSVDALQNVAQRLFDTAQCVAKDQTYLISLAYSAWGEREVMGRFASYKQPETGEVVTCYQIQKAGLKKEDGQLYKKRTSKTGTDLQEGMNRYWDTARVFMQQVQNPDDVRLCTVALRLQFPTEQFNAIKEMAIQLPVPSGASDLQIWSNSGALVFWKGEAEGNPLAPSPEFWEVHSVYIEGRPYIQSFSTLKEALEFVQPHLHAWGEEGDDRVTVSIREFVEEKLPKPKKVQQ